jgi:hypothetical protein
MLSFKKLVNIAGLTVLAITAFVYYLTAERTGSLWDCGEFILGAYKLQVVHPPGAGLFLLVGRIFTAFAEMMSSDKSDIAFAVNLMSSLCSAVAAMSAAWIMMILGKMSLVGRDEEPTTHQNIALTIGGIAAGLSTAWITSIWFSAVEGEVYAMSTMFTALTLWAGVKWYHLPNEKDSDRWLIFSLFLVGLSVGVHLLSILALPAIAILYYYKKFETKSIKGFLLCLLSGLFLIVFIQKIIIVGIPLLWSKFDMLFVNSFGLPFNSGIFPTIITIGIIAYYANKYAKKMNSQVAQNLVFAASLISIAYSVVGVVVIRANADTPINMNTPNDPYRLIPYLNREQYGERPLLKGPHYLAEPIGVDRQDRYGKLGNKYAKVDEKFDYKWKEGDMILFPRIGHQDKADLHKRYKERLTGNGNGKPTFAYNMAFLFKYQLSQMYFRYFFWNFIGRQNFDQSGDIWQVKNGNWSSGIKAYDDARLYNSDLEPDEMSQAPSRNKYYFIPFILGILGMVFHYNKSKKDFLALFTFFIFTGVALIIYANSPPIEPRERDYVLVGSFMAFCIWIGFGALALFELFSNTFKLPLTVGLMGGALSLAAPAILLHQNYDDQDRSHHLGARDYAANFLTSLDKNAIIFTYGDNDTYPLWYAQEVEGIRTDVRVVNLSLIQIDWYINKLRSKVNNSDAIKMTISKESYSGMNLNQVFFAKGAEQPTDFIAALKQADAAVKAGNAYPTWPSKTFFIPFDATKVKQGLFNFDSLQVEPMIPFMFNSDRGDYVTKDDIAIMDLVASNINERPVYFSVTCRNEKMHNINNFTQLEGLGLRVVPVRAESQQNFGIYGSGRVNEGVHYNRIMKDFKWGNFDKVKTHVDKSYMAATQSLRLVMLRGAYAILAKDKKKSSDLANKFFESFPHMNFPYDVSVVPFINVLVAAEDLASAKKNAKILAGELQEYTKFYSSLSSTELGSFADDIGGWQSVAAELPGIADKLKDESFKQEVKKVCDAANGFFTRVSGPQQPTVQ